MQAIGAGISSQVWLWNRRLSFRITLRGATVAVDPISLRYVMTLAANPSSDDSRAAELSSHHLVHSRAYRNGKLIESGFAVASLPEFSNQHETIVWIDVLNPDKHVLEQIASELGVHALALADALNGDQRPKIDRYENHSFLTLYDVEIAPTESELLTREISAFVTANALVTIRRSDQFDITRVLRRWDSEMHLATYGVGYLLWGLLDTIADSYTETSGKIEVAIDELEDNVFGGKRSELSVQQHSFHQQKRLVLFRRVLVPTQEMLNRVLNDKQRLITKELQPYFQDVADHVAHAKESNDALRELVQSILNTDLALQSNRMNDVMKRLTAWAAVIAVPTAVTGFYGQNIPYPGFGAWWGFLTSTFVIVIFVLALIVMFRRKRWM